MNKVKFSDILDAVHVTDQYAFTYLEVDGKQLPVYTTSRDSLCESVHEMLTEQGMSESDIDWHENFDDAFELGAESEREYTANITLDLEEWQGVEVEK